ncbi:hypothetical protein OF83DRAFT_346561 [Amylostereum chailletii]|nr:hypothetical protein OF83DRAFT_346561 [Amylostereum chailletii]
MLKDLTSIPLGPRPIPHIPRSAPPSPGSPGSQTFRPPMSPPLGYHPLQRKKSAKGDGGRLRRKNSLSALARRVTSLVSTNRSPTTPPPPIPPIPPYCSPGLPCNTNCIPSPLCLIQSPDTDGLTRPGGLELNDDVDPSFSPSSFFRGLDAFKTPYTDPLDVCAPEFLPDLGLSSPPLSFLQPAYDSSAVAGLNFYNMSMSSTMSPSATKATHLDLDDALYGAIPLDSDFSFIDFTITTDAHLPVTPTVSLPYPRTPSPRAISSPPPPIQQATPRVLFSPPPPVSTPGSPELQCLDPLAELMAVAQELQAMKRIDSKRLGPRQQRIFNGAPVPTIVILRPDESLAAHLSSAPSTRSPEESYAQIRYQDFSYDCDETMSPPMSPQYETLALSPGLLAPPVPDARGRVDGFVAAYSLEDVSHLSTTACECRHCVTSSSRDPQGQPQACPSTLHPHFAELPPSPPLSTFTRSRSPPPEEPPKKSLLRRAFKRAGGGWKGMFAGKKERKERDRQSLKESIGSPRPLSPVNVAAHLGWVWDDQMDGQVQHSSPRSMF